MKPTEKEIKTAIHDTLTQYQEEQQVKLIRREIGVKTRDVIEDIDSLTIRSEGDYGVADIILVRVRAARKFIKSKIDPIKIPQREALDATMALFHEMDDPLAAGEKKIKEKMGEWQKAKIESGGEKTAGAGSRTVVKKVARVTDLSAFLQGIVAGVVPEICVEVNETVLRTYWEQDRGLVSCWPGVEIVDDVRVGGR